MHEQDFKIEQYDDFYEGHQFTPLPDDMSYQAHRVIPRVAWAVDVAKEIKPKRVLDLGCLDGFILLTISKQADTGGVGVDLSSRGVDIANKRAEKFKLPCEFVQSDIESFMESCKEKFDLITCFELIEHVKDPQKVVELMDSVKAPGGTILISTPSFEAPTFGKNDVKNKCHIRLYTTKDEDYEEMTDLPDPDTGKCYMRKADSISKLVGKKRIIDMGVYSELINLRYE